MKTLIKNAQIVSGKETKKQDLLIEEGIIKKIGEVSEAADITIDAKNKHLLPGVIDPHVHFRDPGFPDKEDFHTGSRAAVAGGVTTVFDMPNTNPPTFTLDELEKKRRLAREKSLCNFAFFFGAGSENLEDIKKCEKVAGIKIYMNVTTGNLLIRDDETLKNIAKVKNKIFALHAEGDTFQKAVDIFTPFGAPIYLCHISLKSEVEIIRHLKKENYPVFAEAAPHHLFMTGKDRETKKGFAMMKPDLATPEDQDAVWEAVQEGIIDTIGSDHAPHTIAEKTGENLAFGVPGVETSLPLMLNEINKGRISLERVVQMMSRNPARIFNVQNKGEIKEGFDADLVLVDLNKSKKIENRNIVSKCKWSPYDTWEVQGAVEKTWVSGELVFSEGKVLESRFRGREISFHA